MKYTPPAGFPTPQLLAQAQKEYAAFEGVDKPLDEDGVPIPFPPPKPKKEVFSREEYRHVDEMAMGVSIILQSHMT